mmetsp:Transcript_69967/g.226295  ORF Transcript_69967/g.226295 Transcript_69967/m.226295 type:complete len:371 (-) Transcript_69967:135-1247(-)
MPARKALISGRSSTQESWGSWPVPEARSGSVLQGRRGSRLGPLLELRTSGARAAQARKAAIVSSPPCSRASVSTCGAGCAARPVHSAAAAPAAARRDAASPAGSCPQAGAAPPEWGSDAAAWPESAAWPACDRGPPRRACGASCSAGTVPAKRCMRRRSRQCGRASLGWRPGSSPRAATNCWAQSNAARTSCQLRSSTAILSTIQSTKIVAYVLAAPLPWDKWPSACRQLWRASSKSLSRQEVSARQVCTHSGVRMQFGHTPKTSAQLIRYRRDSSRCCWESLQLKDACCPDERITSAAWKSHPHRAAAHGSLDRHRSFQPSSPSHSCSAKVQYSEARRQCLARRQPSARRLQHSTPSNASCSIASSSQP